VRGVNIYPSAVEEIIRRYSEVAEFAVEVCTRQALPEMAIQIEPHPDCPDTAALIGRLERDFESALALRVPIKPVPAGTLPRWEMKAARWKFVR